MNSFTSVPAEQGRRHQSFTDVPSKSQLEAERTSLLERAAALRGALQESAEEADRERHLSETTIAALRESGLLRLFTPRRFGGFEATPSTLLDTCALLAQGCSSASWVTSVLNAGNYVAAMFPESVQAELWQRDANACAALVIVAPKAKVERVADGVVISGEWPYASGCLHSEWIAALIPSGPASDEPATHVVLMPKGDVRIKDTWHVTGMRGTGSNTVIADRVLVPTRRTMPYAPLVRGQLRGPAGVNHLYRSSFSGLLSVGLLAPHIGALEYALRFVLDGSGSRRVASSTFASQAQSPAFQTDMAEAGMLLDDAKLHAARIAQVVEEHALAETTPDEITRSRARMEGAHVTRACRLGIDRLMTAYGSSAFAESNPLQRIWRDINVGSRHAGFGMGVPQLVYGRALVGLDPREISYLV